MRLDLDEDAMDKDLVRALRACAVGLQTAREARMIEREDHEHLAHAAVQGRVLYSFNRGDFCRLHADFLATGKDHAGVVLSRQQQYSIGEQMRRLPNHASCGSAERGTLSLFGQRQSWSGRGAGHSAQPAVGGPPGRRTGAQAAAGQRQRHDPPNGRRLRRSTGGLQEVHAVRALPDGYALLWFIWGHSSEGRIASVARSHDYATTACRNRGARTPARFRRPCSHLARRFWFNEVPRPETMRQRRPT